MPVYIHVKLNKHSSEFATNLIENKESIHHVAKVVCGQTIISFDESIEIYITK